MSLMMSLLMIIYDNFNTFIVEAIAYDLIYKTFNVVIHAWLCNWITS